MIEKIIQLYDTLSTGDLASIIGLLVTVIGFVITIIKVTKSKNAATLAEEAVYNVRQDLRLYQTVHGFSNSISIMREIKNLHRREDWVLLPDKYSDLRLSLITIRAENPVLSETDKKEIQSAISQFTSLEKLIDRHFSEEKKKIDVPKINSIVSKQIDSIHGILSKLNTNVGKKHEL